MRTGSGGKCPLAAVTFQPADLRLTVRPLLVTVHFIRMKKSRSVLSSLPFLPKPLPEKRTQTLLKQQSICQFSSLK